MDDKNIKFHQFKGTNSSLDEIKEACKQASEQMLSIKVRAPISPLRLDFSNKIQSIVQNIEKWSQDIKNKRKILVQLQKAVKNLKELHTSLQQDVPFINQDPKRLSDFYESLNTLDETLYQYCVLSETGVHLDSIKRSL